MLKKDKKEKKQTPQPTEFSHGPHAKREDRLSMYLKWSLVSNVVLIVMAGMFATAAVLKPDRVLVSEKDTGRIVGEYRTTAYRTSDELLAGAIKFAENFLSLNSRTVYNDCASAMNMMSPALQKNRTAYLKRTNLLKKIELGNTRSLLQIKENKLLTVKGRFAKCEISGDIVVDQNRSFASSKSRSLDSEDVKLNRNNIPFRLLVDLKMVPVTTHNTAGVEVVDYYEHD